MRQKQAAKQVRKRYSDEFKQQALALAAKDGETAIYALGVSRLGYTGVGHRPRSTAWFSTPAMAPRSKTKPSCASPH